MRLLVPMFAIGCLFTLFIDGSLSGFFMNSAKYGYWYLEVLAIFYLMLAFMRIIIKGEYLYTFLLVALFIWIVFIIIARYVTQENDLFCMLNCKRLWPYFVTGYLLRIHPNILRFICSERIYAVSFIATILSLYVYIVCGFTPIRHIIPIFAVAAVVKFFRERENSDSFVERRLEYIGKKTLYVYLFHYFLVYSLHLGELGNVFANTGNYLIEQIFTSFMAVIVTYISIGIGNIIGKSNILSAIVYGKFIK